MLRSRFGSPKRQQSKANTAQFSGTKSIALLLMQITYGQKGIPNPQTWYRLQGTHAKLNLVKLQSAMYAVRSGFVECACSRLDIYSFFIEMRGCRLVGALGLHVHVAWASLIDSIIQSLSLSTPFRITIAARRLLLYRSQSSIARAAS